MDKEITYFEVLTSLLKYNRLKLSYEKSQYEEQAGSAGLGLGLYNDFTLEGDVGRAKGLTAAGGMGEVAGRGAGVVATATGWVPSLQNVINALDNLSFRRVFESLEKLQTTQVKRFADMVSPLGLYKEMMCYLRVLLESSDETHNEFAIARLYSIFYTSSERKDPLPRILAEWSPGMPLKKQGLFNCISCVRRATIFSHITCRTCDRSQGCTAGSIWTHWWSWCTRP